MKYYQPQKRHNPKTQRFIFATGIEYSYPTIQTETGKKRRDQLTECGHYERWREDFELVRYGVCATKFRAIRRLEKLRRKLFNG